MAAPENKPIRGYEKTTSPLDGMTITWKDGLPKDTAEESQTEATLVMNNLSSHYSAIKRLLDGDDEATQREMEKINEEMAQAAMAQADPAGSGAGVPTGTPAQPGANQLAQSAQLLAQLQASQQRDGTGGGTRKRDEGGPKSQPKTP